MKSRFIALEGLHGVGKSTVVRMLQEKYGLRRMPTVTEEFEGLRKIVDRISNVDTRFMFYMSAVLHAGEAIGKALAGGESVIVESYLYRTMAFHGGMGTHLQVTTMEGLLLPTHVFHLRCADTIRKDRIATRSRMPKPWDVLAEERADAILTAYRQFPMHEIDTTSASAEAVTDSIMELVNSGVER